MAEKTTRSELKEQSRQRLVKAAISVLSEQGMARLTTGKIARAAGLSQPSFYVHFSDMEDLLTSVAELVIEPVRGVLETTLDKLQAEGFSGADMAQGIRAGATEALDALLADPKVAEVLLAHRRDRTPLGKGIRKAQDELHAALVRIFEMLFPEPQVKTDFHAQAELTMAIALGALEGILDERLTKDACLDVLVMVMTTSIAALVGKPVEL